MCCRSLPGGRRATEDLEAVARRRFFLVPAIGNGHVHLDHFEVLGQGKLETTRPDAPVEEGASLELKLVEVGLHDPTAAVGKLDGGYEVVVAGASKLVGKKVKVTIGRALDGVAYAALADDAAATIVAPITFEAEAEKPTRASEARRSPSTAATGEPARSWMSSPGRGKPRRQGRRSADGSRRRSGLGGDPRWPWPQEAGAAAAPPRASRSRSEHGRNRRDTAQIHVPPRARGCYGRGRALPMASRGAEGVETTPSRCRWTAAQRKRSAADRVAQETRKARDDGTGPPP